MSTDDVALNEAAAIDFRKVAGHDYTRRDLAIVRAIIENHAEDLQRFASAAIRASDEA